MVRTKFSHALSGLFVAGLLALGIVGESAANIIYNIDRTIGAGGVTGTVETDGTIGVLDEVNIVDWDLVLDDGAGTFTLNGTANSEVRIDGVSFSATASQLLFDFGAADVSFVLFQNPSIGGSTNFWCVENTGCVGLVDTENVKLDAGIEFVARTGVVEIGTAQVLPVPATVALLGLGLAGLGFARRRAA